MLYSQLGLTKEILAGTADEKTMLNYQNRTIEPVITAFVESVRRTFLTKTARTQGQTLAYFWDPFKLVPVSQIADIADKLTRNEIASSNEIRQVIGWKPVRNDPKADQLRNSNMPQSELGAPPVGGEQTSIPVDQPGGAVDLSGIPDPSAANAGPDFSELDNIMNDALGGVSSDIDKMLQALG